MNPQENIPLQIKRRIHLIDKVIDNLLPNMYPCDYNSSDHFVEGVLDEIIWFLVDVEELKGIERMDIENYILDYKYDELTEYFNERCIVLKNDNLQESIRRILREESLAVKAKMLDMAAIEFYNKEVPTSTDVITIANYWEGGGYVWAGGTGLGIPLMWVNPETGKEEVLKDKQANGTYCSGYALQVGYIAAKNRGLIEGKTKPQLLKFIREWYQSNPKTCVTAITNLGIGVEYTLEEAQPGDFCQLWRTKGSGHNVIFLSHIKEGNKIIGINYRSTQKSTNGIGNNKEYFSDSGKGSVLRNKIFFARLNS